MKLVQEVKRYEVVGVKKGDVVRLEDTMSCNQQLVKIVDITPNSMKVLKLSNGDVSDITLEELARYEATRMRIVEEDKIVRKEPTKVECEKATDEYEKQLENAIFEQLLRRSKGVRVSA